MVHIHHTYNISVYLYHCNVLARDLPGLGARIVLQFPAQLFRFSLLVELRLLSKCLCLNVSLSIEAGKLYLLCLWC